MGRPSAGERLKRLLALLPWLAAHPGSTIAEISERFGLSPQQLEDDLAVVWMVGVPPYTPDQLIDVEFDGDVTTEGPGKAFERPDHVRSGAERQPWELGDDEPVEARVLVDADQAGYAVHLTGEAAVAERHDDGSVELALPVSNPVAFRSFV
ncbi:MAG: hypothetical protein ABWZ89_06380, partial [Acidimicrobiales bacterium]